MKHFRRLLTLVVALVMTLGLVAPVFAEDTNAHTITVTTKGDGQHTYTAYQVFKGNLNADETKLSNIEWGTGVNGATIIAALQADDTLKADFPATKEVEGEQVPVTYTAEDVAKILATYTGTDNAAKLKAFAKVIGNNVSTAAGTASGNKTTPAVISVSGDGYYLVKDTGTIPDGDTQTEFMLKVADDIEVDAKDTSMTPDKEIKEVDGDSVEGKTADAAIGDVVTFTVDITVPDTSAYKKNFWFVMNDKLPDGLTFTGITSVKVADVATDPEYKLKVDSTEYANPATFVAPDDPVTAKGGNAIKLTFKDFKNYVVSNEAAGKTLTVTYTAVINDDAVFGKVGNSNKVHFDYSNDPNSDYDGDDIPDTPTVPVGKTPESTTTSFVTKLKIVKVDGKDKSKKLAGATFEIEGTEFNRVLETGEKYEKAPYPKDGEELPEGETVETGDYYKLVDGSYTATKPVKDTENPNNDTTDQYDNPEEKYVRVSYSRVVTTSSAVKYTVTTDKNGEIKLEGLKAGNYTVKETIAPDGYNLDDTTYTLIVDWTDPTAKDEDGNLTTAADAVKNSGGFSLKTGSSEGWSMSNDGAEFTITINNFSGTELPSTGGMGTTLFYVVGTLLVLGAGVVLVSKRKISE